MGLKRSRDFVLTLEDDDIVSQSESEDDSIENSGNQKKKKIVESESLNPDFDFDDFGVSGGVSRIDSEGWGFEGVNGVKKGAGVDLNGIIERRRGTFGEKASEFEEDEVELESGDNSEEYEEFKGFDEEDEEIGISLQKLY
jgi:hypothetical protein